MVEGNSRARTKEFKGGEDYFIAAVELVTDEASTKAAETEILARSILTQFDQYIKLNKKILCFRK